MKNSVFKVLSVIFELFYVYQSLTRSREFVRGRELDVIIMSVFVIQTIIFLYQASHCGSLVSEKVKISNVYNGSMHEVVSRKI